MNHTDFGLTEQELREIVTCIKTREMINEALVFGSRAKGTYSKGSDIDIALKGNSVSHEDVREISMKLNEESYLPWHFDIINYNTIDNQNLREHIDRVGKLIYQKGVKIWMNAPR